MSGNETESRNRGGWDLIRVGLSHQPHVSSVVSRFGSSAPSCPRRRASRCLVPCLTEFLDSRFRGNDVSSFPSAKELPLKGGWDQSLSFLPMIRLFVFLFVIFLSCPASAR